MFLAAAALAATGLVITAGAAGAAPQPSIAQVQAKLNKLTAQENVLIQRYDQVSQELASARQRLKLVDQAVVRDKIAMHGMQGTIGGIASAAYMNGNLNSPLSILTSTSSSAQTALAQSAFLTKLSTSEQQQLAQGALVANALTDAKASVQRTESAVAALDKQLGGQKANLEKVITKQKGILSTLTAQQQTTLTGGGAVIGGNAVTGGNNPVPTNTQAGKAVAFAFAQLGCPYVFGGTGPCSSGFDCSGLTMQAWAAAGVAIPRTSYAQAGLPSVPMSAIQPGDILEFTGDSHVGIYVGGGKLIDAPQPGQNVEEVSLSGWYSANLDGAVRP
jgi:cell wall-associated NlpC family hydrolase